MFKYKIFIVLNLFILFIIFCLLFAYNQTQIIYMHDLFWPYKFFDGILNGNFSPRIIPNLINYLYSVLLPNCLNMHPLDFRTNIVVCSISSLCLTFSIVLFAKGFFINSDDNKPILNHFECILLLPLIFLYVYAPFFKELPNISDCYIFNSIFMGIDDLSVFFEHCGGFIFYVLFLTILFNIILHNKKYTPKQEIGLIILGIALGLWSEFINLPLFISLVYICFLDLIIKSIKKDKEKYNLIIFKNSSSKKMIIAFIIGMLIFYFGTGEFTTTHFGTISEYNIFTKLGENLANINNFNQNFIDFFFKPTEVYLLIITACIFIAIFIITEINQSHQIKEKNFFQLFLTLTPIISFLLTSYLTVFVQNYREGFAPYIFQTEYYRLLYYIFLGYNIILVLGYVYNFSEKHFKKCLIIIFICIGIHIGNINFISTYPQLIQIRNNNKRAIYNLEKLICIYSNLDEKIIISKDNFSNPIINEMYLGNGGTGTTHAIDFLTKRYGFDYKGVIIVDTIEKEQQELQKRLNSFGGGILPIKNRYNLFGQIQFSNLKKITNKQEKKS